MNEEVQKKAMEMLEALATKLGTTVDHLWKMMVAQAGVEAINTFVALGMSIVLVWVTHHYVWRWMWKKPDSDGRTWVTMLLTTLATITTIKGFLGLFSLATKLLNPEYWAFRAILRLF